MQSSAGSIQKVLSGSAFRVFYFVTQMCVAFFLTPLIIKSLGDRMFGLWSLLASIIGYYGLLDLGLSTAVTRHVAGAMGRKDHDACNRIFNTALFLYGGLGCVALLLSISLAALAPVLLSRPEDIYIFRAVILLLGVDVAIGLPERVLGGVLASELQFAIESSLQLLALVLRSILVVAVLVTGHGIVALALVTVISRVPVRFLHVYFTRKKIPFLRVGRRYFNGATVKQLFSFSAFIFIGQIANQLRFHLDYVVITIFLGLAAVTHYKIAALLVSQYNMLMFAFTGVLHPLFSRLEGGSDQAGIRKIFVFGTKLSMIPSSFIAFGFLVWGRPFIEVWMGPGYLIAYPSLLVLTISTAVMLWQHVSINLFIGTSRHKFLALLNSTEGVANLLLSVMLVQRFGILGVALGTAIPMLVCKLLIQPIYASKAAGVPYKTYAAGMCRTAATITAILLVPGWLSLRYTRPTYPSLMLFGFISLFIYSIGSWFVVLNARERKMIRGTFGPWISSFLPGLEWLSRRKSAKTLALKKQLLQDE